MFQNVDPKTLNLNPFAAIGDQWMLITAGTPDPYIRGHACGRRKGGVQGHLPSAMVVAPRHAGRIVCIGNRYRSRR